MSDEFLQPESASERKFPWRSIALTDNGLLSVDQGDNTVASASLDRADLEWIKQRIEKILSA